MGLLVEGFYIIIVVVVFVYCRVFSIVVSGAAIAKNIISVNNYRLRLITYWVS